MRGDLESHPARGAWIEIKTKADQRIYKKKSHPARGAWIEILFQSYSWLLSSVAPRKGCVD